MKIVDGLRGAIIGWVVLTVVLGVIGLFTGEYGLLDAISYIPSICKEFCDMSLADRALTISIMAGPLLGGFVSGMSGESFGRVIGDSLLSLVITFVVIVVWVIICTIFETFMENWMEACILLCFLAAVFPVCSAPVAIIITFFDR